MNKIFYIRRLEESRVLKKIEYEVVATNKIKAIQNLNRMKYTTRDTVEEVQEDCWKPNKIISITMQDM